MQGAEKLAVDKRNEMVDAFAKAAAIGGEAGKQAQNELLKILTPEEMNKIIQERNPTPD